MKQSTKEIIHTTIQVAAGIAAAVPLFVTTGDAFYGASTLLAVSALVTRVMSLDVVQQLLSKFGLDNR